MESKSKDLNPTPTGKESSVALNLQKSTDHNYFEYPIWTRSIELEPESLQYKTDIRQYLSFFEYYLNDIAGNKNQEALVSTISNSDGMELQVVSITFTPEEVDAYYENFIAFLAEPKLINKVINKIKRDNPTLENELIQELLNSLVKLKKQTKELDEGVRDSYKYAEKLDKDKTERLEKEVSELKTRILGCLTESQNLQKDKQYFQDIIKNFSRQNITIIDPKTTIMNQQNFQNSTINNSGNINFGKNYGELVSNSRQKIVEMVKPNDLGEDKLIQIQGYLIEILELITTNQQIPENKKEMAIKSLDIITENSKHQSEVGTDKLGIIKTALETISSIFEAVGGTISNMETVKNLAGILGLKL